MHKAATRILTMLALAASALLINCSEMSDAEEEYIFDEGDYYYMVMGNGEVGILMLSAELESGTAVTIPGTVSHDGATYTVTAILDSAFEGTDIGSVIIADSVRTIGKCNFDFCPELTSVVMGDGVEKIGGSCFYECPQLDHVEFSPVAKTIGNSCFQGCPRLTVAGIVGNGNPHLGFDGNMLVFNNVLLACLGPCPAAYTMSDSITSVSEFVFYGNSELEEIVLSDSLLTIGTYAFGQCSSLRSVSFPVNLIVIESYAFWKCTALQEVDLPNNLRMIEDVAFGYCDSLSHVYLGPMTSFIGDGAFMGCPSLKGFEVSELNTSYVCEDGILYLKHSTTQYSYILSLLQYPQGREAEGGTLDLGSKYNLGTIKTYAFTFSETSDEGPGALRRVILPETLQSIELSAFEECLTLREINIPASIETLETFLFYRCTSLEKVELNEGLERIQYSFVGCISLQDVRLPNTLTYISGGSFAYCTSITEIILPDNSVEVGYGTFDECTSLGKITVVNQGTVLTECSLIISTDPDHPASLDLYVPEGYTVPDNVFGEYTEGHVKIIGKPPYPYENWIIIAIIAVLMVGLLRFVRRV